MAAAAAQRLSGCPPQRASGVSLCCSAGAERWRTCNPKQHCQNSKLLPCRYDSHKQQNLDSKEAQNPGLLHSTGAHRSCVGVHAVPVYQVHMYLPVHSCTKCLKRLHGAWLLRSRSKLALNVLQDSLCCILHSLHSAERDWNLHKKCNFACLESEGGETLTHVQQTVPGHCSCDHTNLAGSVLEHLSHL